MSEWVEIDATPLEVIEVTAIEAFSGPPSVLMVPVPSRPARKARTPRQGGKK